MEGKKEYIEKIEKKIEEFGNFERKFLINFEINNWKMAVDLMEYKQIFELFFGELIVKLVENLDIIDVDILENKRLEIVEEKFKKYREEIEEEENLEEEKIGEKLQEIVSKLNIERELTEKYFIIIF